jgi:hypothetical protein
MNSYLVSGKDSVRLLLMTATPITQNPMELIQLVNLCKSPKEQMPSQFEDFAMSYLNESGEFTERGKHQYLDDIAGYVSYLNREKDARQFSQPIIEHISVPITDDVEQAKKFDKKIVRDYLESNAADLQSKIAENNELLKDELSDLDPNKFSFLNDICENLDGKSLSQCNKLVKSNIKQLVNEAKEEVRRIRDGIKELKDSIKAENASRKDSLKQVKENIEAYEQDYDEYKKTPLYALKNKCSVKITKPTELKEKLESEDAELIQYNEDIRNYNKKIEELRDQLKTEMIVYKMRMDRLKKILKTDLNDLERSVINMIVREVKTTRKNVLKIKNKTVREGEKTIKSSIQKTEKRKRMRFKAIKKTIKKIVKDNNRNKKTQEKEEKKMRKTLRKQGELKEEIKDKILVDLVEKYRTKIRTDLDSNIEETRQKEEEKAALKEQKRMLKETEKENKRAQKEIEKQAIKLQKQKEKDAVKREKATLKLQKMADKKTRKNKV